MSEHLVRAEQLLSHSKFDMAIKEVDQHLVSDPNDGYAYYLKALAFLQMNDEKQALENARKSVSLSPDVAAPHYVLSMVHLNLTQDYKASETHIREALRLEPEHPYYYAILAHLHMLKNEYQEALEIASAGLEVDPENSDCKNAKAMALTKLNRKDEASALLNETLADEPENVETLTNKGWYLLEHGNHREALEVFRDALVINPNYEPAKHGLVNALKAENFLFRWFLKYYFWLDRMGTKAQWGFVIGIWFVARIINSVNKSNPELSPILTPLLYLYIAFVVLSWSIDPIFNLFLRLNKYGRHALDRGEVIASNIVGGFIGASVLFAIAAIILKSSAVGFQAMVLFGMIIPIAGTFSRYEQKGFNILKWFTIAIFGFFVIGLASLLIGASGSAFIGLSFLGIIAFTWVANFVGK